jgi:acyl dehydratase
MSNSGSSDKPTVPDEGDVITHERTVTPDEVREFGSMTGDTQAIHSEPDDGRLVVQGLLSGSLMTTIGGDLEYIARTLAFEFLKPV